MACALRFVSAGAMLTLIVFVVHLWLQRYPEHDPFAPLDARQPRGWATGYKLSKLRTDSSECRAMLTRSGIAFRILAPSGEKECRRADRTLLTEAPFRPDRVSTTCAVGAGFELWLRHGVEPAALEILGSPIAGIEHLGAYSCRRMYGLADGRWSEHATGNALDIAAFILKDGRRVSVLKNWRESGEKSIFLKRVRDEACHSFTTVLSPDYNAAHADHFHLDQAERGFDGVCR